MISTRLLRPLAVIACAMGLLVASPASAHFAAGVMTGTGTIIPGLPTTGCQSNQNVTFDGTAILVGGHTGIYAIHFQGTSNICETLNAGSGCGTVSGDVTASVCYSRTVNVVTATGTATIDGQTHTVSLTCVFAATSVNPVTTYGLVCQIVVQ